MIWMADKRTASASPKPQILTDAAGNPTHVVLTIDEFEELEELIDDLRAFQEFEARNTLLMNVFANQDCEPKLIGVDV